MCFRSNLVRLRGGRRRVRRPNCLSDGYSSHTSRRVFLWSHRRHVDASGQHLRCKHINSTLEWSQRILVDGERSSSLTCGGRRQHVQYMAHCSSRITRLSHRSHGDRQGSDYASVRCCPRRSVMLSSPHCCRSQRFLDFPSARNMDADRRRPTFSRRGSDEEGNRPPASETLPTLRRFTLAFQVGIPS